MAGQLNSRLPGLRAFRRMVRAGGGGPPGPSIFLPAAQKILARLAAPRTLSIGGGSPPTIDISNTGNSTINNRSLANGGLTANTAVPNGRSGPLEPNAKWIVTKAPGVSTPSNLTFAPGNSKLFGCNVPWQRIEFKAGISGGNSFSVRWSEDGGTTWFQTATPIVVSAVCWVLITFASTANRIVEIIGENEIFQTFGFNFDAGISPVEWNPADDPDGMMFGDSYVFCQGTRSDGIANNQQATIGMCRKFAERLGVLQIYNNGFRTNGFANNHAGVQSYFHERLDMAGTPEALVWDNYAAPGSLEYVVMPGTVNDGALFNTDPTLAQELVRLAFVKLRAAQPYALIIFPFGFSPPTYGESSATFNGYINAFKAAFGATEAEQTANGAAMLNGTSILGGAGWIPRGAEGSSAYFPASPLDKDHPTAIGHDKAAELYLAVLVALAQRIAGVVSTDFVLREDGSFVLREDGSKIIRG